MGNLNNDNFLKCFVDDCFDKILKSEIFTFNEIGTDIQQNTKLFFQLNNIDKELVIESLKETSLYNNDFSHLLIEYLKEKNEIINLKNFKSFIKKKNSGYYRKKAIISFIIRFLLILGQLVILYLLKYPKKICIDKPFDKEDKTYWTFNDENYKIIIVKRDKEFYCRTIIFIIDFIFYFCEGFVLARLQRIKGHKCSIISLQILKFFAHAYITFYNIFYISYKNYCDNNVLEIILMIYDIIKSFVG